MGFRTKNMQCLRRLSNSWCRVVERCFRMWSFPHPLLFVICLLAKEHKCLLSDGKICKKSHGSSYKMRRLVYHICCISSAKHGYVWTRTRYGTDLTDQLFHCDNCSLDITWPWKSRYWIAAHSSHEHLCFQ